MKCATFHFVSAQVNRLGHFCLNSGSALLPYKDYVVFRQITTITLKSAGIFLLLEYAHSGNTVFMCQFTPAIDKSYRTHLESVTMLQNEYKRRDRLYIIAEILNIAKSGCLKTQIMYRANLSFAQLNEYLTFLTKIHLITIKNENKRTVYKTSTKGNRYLEKYEDIADLLGNDEE